jgi:tRNA (cytidine/uridine-2'-O-)-methyltransferase
MLNIVLYAPRIPQNTGQIARSCIAMNCRLHLVRPLGFRMDTASLKRSAVGYLKQMDIRIYDHAAGLWDAIRDHQRTWLVSKHGRHVYDSIRFKENDWLIFGNETEGLPGNWLEKDPDHTLVIPMLNPDARCLNLATAASVVMFEAIRQVRPDRVAYRCRTGPND